MVAPAGAPFQVEAYSRSACASARDCLANIGTAWQSVRHTGCREAASHRGFTRKREPERAAGVRSKKPSVSVWVWARLPQGGNYREVKCTNSEVQQKQLPKAVHYYIRRPDGRKSASHTSVAIDGAANSSSHNRIANPPEEARRQIAIANCRLAPEDRPNVIAWPREAVPLGDDDPRSLAR